MNNPTMEEYIIFNGTYKFITRWHELKMSHWVKTFGLIDHGSGLWILEPVPDYNLESFEETGNILKVIFTRYPLAVEQHEIHLDPFRKIFIYNNKPFDLKDFYRFLE